MKKNADFFFFFFFFSKKKLRSENVLQLEKPSG